MAMQPQNSFPSSPSGAPSSQPSSPSPLDQLKSPYNGPKPDPERDPKKGPKQDRGIFREILSIFGVLISAVLLAFVLITFVFQSYQVEGPSMQKTLENRDHLIVWKLGKTIDRALGKQYTPNRGDIVIFTEPMGSACNGAGKQLIKRVIGLPGEHVVYRGTTLTVYNSAHPEGFSPDVEGGYSDKLINEKPSNTDFTLGSDEVFVSGDNRDNSTDSRCFGPLKTNQIIGKLALRVLPLNQFKLF